MVEHGPVKTKKHTHTNNPGMLFVNTDIDNLWFYILAYITTSEFQLPLCFCYFYQFTCLDMKLLINDFVIDAFTSLPITIQQSSIFIITKKFKSVFYCVYLACS